VIRVELLARVDNLCDYTFNFCWHNRQLDPDAPIPHQNGTEYTYREVVDALKTETEVHIKGDVGERLAQGMGADIRHLGGTGGIGIATASRIFVDGDVGAEAGLGMVAGAVYVSGMVEEPLGNILEVRSDVTGYRKFVSVTDLLCNRRPEAPVSNSLDPEKLRLVLHDGILRGTLCARCDCPVEVLVEGDAHNGTGLLMRQGTVTVTGDAGMNTGAHLNGGTVVVRGVAGEFAGAYMKGGVLLVGGGMGYAGADMKGGAIYSRRKIAASPPAEKTRITGADMSLIRKLVGAGRFESMRYSKYEVGTSEKYVAVPMRDGSLVMRKVG
jgi:formylmethanofuran dehydrogenase subunit C